MKAMIFAAGVGSRLKPLSHHTPKALVELGQKPILQLVAEKLIRSGARALVINVHHHHDKMKRFISALSFPGVEIIISDETDQLLDTGGGLAKARKFLEGNEPIVLHNVDVISDIDIEKMVEFHHETNSLATLAVSRRDTGRYLLFNQGRLTGWINSLTGKEIKVVDTPSGAPEQLAFSGVQVIEPGLLNLMPRTGKFSIVDVYLELAASHVVSCFEHDSANWADIGTLEKYEKARKLFEANPTAFQ